MMKMEVAGFEWDEGNWEKCEKHGVTRAEIGRFFVQDRLHVAPSPRASHGEERYLAVGRGEKGRPMFVVFTLRQSIGGIVIRPISARYMHKKEAQRYEKEMAKNED